MAQSQRRIWQPSRGSGMQSATWGHSGLPGRGKRTLPDRRSPLLLFPSQTTALPPGSPHFEYRPHQKAPSETCCPHPIAGHDHQDPGVRKAMGLSCAKHPSSDLMTWIFKTSQISGQKDTATAKCTRSPILQIFHPPKPGGLTLWQEAGHTHTTRPREKRTPVCPLGGPARDHTSVREKT